MCLDEYHRQRTERKRKVKDKTKTKKREEKKKKEKKKEFCQTEESLKELTPAEKKKV